MLQKNLAFLILPISLVGSSLFTDAWAQHSERADLNANTIMYEMAGKYASIDTYRDTGTVTSEHSIVGGIDLTSDTIRFSTVFVRPDQFRFQFEYQYPSSSDWNRYVVHADSTGVRTMWDIHPGTREEQSLSFAIAGATGVSRGAAHTVPALLLPDVIDGWRVTEMQDLSRIDDGAIDGRTCFRIRGEHARGMSLVIWIDPETFLIKRIESRFSGMLTTVYATTDYTPEIDIPIDADALRF